MFLSCFRNFNSHPKIYLLFFSSSEMVDRVMLASTSKPSIERISGRIASSTHEVVELKSYIIQLIKINCQFFVLTLDDQNAHLNRFINISDSLKQLGIFQDVIRLYFFLPLYHYMLKHGLMNLNSIQFILGKNLILSS